MTVSRVKPPTADAEAVEVAIYGPLSVSELSPLLGCAIGLSRGRLVAIVDKHESLALFSGHPARILWAACGMS